MAVFVKTEGLINHSLLFGQDQPLSIRDRLTDSEIQNAKLALVYSKSDFFFCFCSLYWAVSQALKLFETRSFSPFFL